MHNVAGQAPQAKRQFACKKEGCAHNQQQPSQNQQRAAKFTRRIHGLSDGSNPANRVVLFRDRFRADREGIQQVQAERVFKRFILLAA